MTDFLDPSGLPRLPPCPVPATKPLASAASPPQSLLAPLLPPTPVLPPDQPLPAVHGRHADGRFAVGNAGRPAGARHRTTRAMEALLEGQWEGLTKTAIAQALRGDTIALRICMDRIAPIRRGSVIEIPEFPKIAGVEDVPKAHAAIVAAVTAGIVSAEEVAPVSSLLAAYIGSVDAVTFALRLEALEQQLESAQANGSR